MVGVEERALTRPAVLRTVPPFVANHDVVNVGPLHTGRGQTSGGVPAIGISGFRTNEKRSMVRMFSRKSSPIFRTTNGNRNGPMNVPRSMPVDLICHLYFLKLRCHLALLCVRGHAALGRKCP